jgi:hypothetical protein
MELASYYVASGGVKFACGYSCAGDRYSDLLQQNKNFGIHSEAGVGCACWAQDKHA